jgi:kinetochore protein Spc7/SPC105
MFDNMALVAGKENVAPATSSDPLQRKGLSPRKNKGRSKSIGPGGLDEDDAQKSEQKDEMKNRRKSAFVPAVRGILPSQADAERKAARRKSMANRRVSFAPEATLHTWDVIEYMRDHTTSTESSESTRRASGITQNSSASPGSEPPSTPPEQSSSPAQSPAHQRDLHQKKRRRVSAVPPMNFNNPDDLESSMISGSSEVSGSEEEDEGESEGEDEDATGTAMSLDMGDNSLLSTTDSDASTSSSARLERNLRDAANAAGTRGIEYDEAYEEENSGDESMEIAGDEVTNAFRPWAQRHAEEEDEPILSAALDQENVNPFSPAFQASVATMLKPRYSTIEEEGEEEDEEQDDQDMSMDVTRAVGGILQARTDNLESSPGDGDGTMDFTQAIGKINGNTQAQSPTRSAKKRRRSTAEAGSPGFSAAQQSKRRRSSMARSSVGDETMDLTIAIGGVLESGSPVKTDRRRSVARRRSPGAASEADEATMDFTQAIGGIHGAKRESIHSLGEDEDLSMELTTALGGVQAAERAAAEELPSTPQEPGSPAALAAAANTTPKDQERFRDVPDTGARKSLTPVLQKEASRSAEKPLSAKVTSARPRKSSSPAKSSPVRQKTEVKQLRLTRSAAKEKPVALSRGSPLKNEVSYPELPSPGVPVLQTESTPLPPVREIERVERESRAQLFAVLQDPEPSPSVEKQLRTTPVKQAPKVESPLIFASPQRKPHSARKALTPKMATPEPLSTKATTPKSSTPKAVTPKAGTPKDATPKASTPKTASPKATTPRTGKSGKSTTPKTASTKRHISQTLCAETNPSTPQETQTLEHVTPMQETTPRARAAPGVSLKEATRLADSIKLMSTPRKETLKSLTPKKQTPKKQVSPMKRPTPAGKPDPKFRNGAQKSPAQQLSDDIFNMQPVVEKQQIRLQDFLDAASIRFMDLTTTKRRMTYAPTPSKRRRSNADEVVETEITLEGAVVAAACTEPEKELFSHACHELKRYIHEGKGAIKELEAETFQDTPRLLQAYMSATSDRKMAIDAQLRDMKTHARLRSKEMWYGWRSQLLDELMHVLQGIAEGLLKDDETLQVREEILGQVLPQMIEKQESLQQEVQQLEAEANSTSDEEKGELEAARARITSVDAELEEKRRILEELQYDTQEQDEIEENLRETKDEFTAAIKEAERVRESYRTISMDEINALKGEPGANFIFTNVSLTNLADSVRSLEDTYGWSITTATSSPPTVTMTYKSSLQLFFHPPAFRNPNQEANTRPNAPIGLTYTSTTQPLPTTIRFFLQLLRASLHALPQCATKVSSLLHFVSSGWTTALAVAESERRLAIEGLTETRIVSDERLSIASLILLPKTKTKVRVSFEILAAIGEGLALSESVEVDVRVVYGETLNEKKMKDVLQDNVSGGVDGWESAVREVKALLLSKSAKVVQR